MPAVIALPAYALPAVLPDDVATLKALLRAQQVAHEAAVEVAVNTAVETVRRQAQEQITCIIEPLVLARHRQFGVSSEQLAGQARLFDEAEVLAQTTSAADDIAPILTETSTGEADGKKPANAAHNKRNAASAAPCQQHCRAWTSSMMCPSTSAPARTARQWSRLARM